MQPHPDAWTTVSPPFPLPTPRIPFSCRTIGSSDFDDGQLAYFDGRIWGFARVSFPSSACVLLMAIATSGVATRMFFFSLNQGQGNGMGKT